MKKMTCSQMGGPAACNTILTGNTPEEIVQHGMKHIEQAHPDMAENIKAMSKEETEKWMEEFKNKWDATPDI